MRKCKIHLEYMTPKLRRNTLKFLVTLVFAIEKKPVPVPIDINVRIFEIGLGLRPHFGLRVISGLGRFVRVDIRFESKKRHFCGT